MLSEYMGSCSCPPGHLIILLTSNKFNMAAVLVKGLIIYFYYNWMAEKTKKSKKE